MREQKKQKKSKMPMFIVGCFGAWGCFVFSSLFILEAGRPPE